MLKKIIKYVDYDGNEREETFYFNLSKAEILEMNVTPQGGLEKYIKKITETQNGAELMKLFKDIILRAYGEKSLDGKRFVKSEEISEAFSQTEAYSELVMELITNADKASEFIKGVIPADLQVENK